MKYSKHSTYYNKDNEEVPSVTTILKILNKPSLPKWANIMGFKHKNIDDILEKSSEIGTTVHKMIESYFNNKYFILIPTRHMGRDLAMSYLNSFFQWKQKHSIEPIFTEHHTSSDKFGGTIDFYGNVDGKKTILDFKTSKTFYATMFLQLGAYCIMLEEQGYEVEQLAIIVVRNYTFKEKFITREQVEPYMKVFRILVDLFHEWYELNEQEGWGNILGN